MFYVSCTYVCTCFKVELVDVRNLAVHATRYDVREIPPACYQRLLERFSSRSALGKSKDGEAEKRRNTEHNPV